VITFLRPNPRKGCQFCYRKADDVGVLVVDPGDMAALTARQHVWEENYSKWKEFAP